jgi:hypothetical protein
MRGGDARQRNGIFCPTAEIAAVRAPAVAGCMGRRMQCDDPSAHRQCRRRHRTQFCDPTGNGLAHKRRSLRSELLRRLAAPRHDICRIGYLVPGPATGPPRHPLRHYRANDGWITGRFAVLLRPPTRTGYQRYLSVWPHALNRLIAAAEGIHHVFKTA